MKKLPVAAHLSDGDYKHLLQVYANHNRNMGLDDRRQHTLSDIVKVVKKPKEKCLEVHYQNGNWWHYSANGSWW